MSALPGIRCRVLLCATVCFAVVAPGKAQAFHHGDIPTTNILWVDDDATSDPGPNDPSVSDPLEDGSADHPFDEVQEAIDASTDGQAIVVRDGLYVSPDGTAPVADLFGKAVWLASESGPTSCILRGGEYVLRVEGPTSPSAVVTGFTILGGGMGGGVGVFDADPQILNNVVTQNRSSETLAAVVLHNSRSIFAGNLVVGNESLDDCAGVLVCCGSSVTLANNTIADNMPLFGICCDPDSTATIVNSIVWNNGPFDLNNCTATYSNIGNPPPGPTNISANPQFISPGFWTPAGFVMGNYRLQAISPSIDVGLDAAVPELLETDLDGNDRIFGASVDQGAYEFVPEADEAVPAKVRITPRTLNRASKGKWISGHIQLPAGYDVRDIHVDSILLNNTVPAELHPTGFDDDDGDGIMELMVKFSRADVIALLEETGDNEITLNGFVGDEFFEGMDVIRVIQGGPREFRSSDPGMDPPERTKGKRRVSR